MSLPVRFRNKAKDTTVQAEIIVETETAWQAVPVGTDRVTLLKKAEWYEYTSPTFADLFSTSPMPANPFADLFGATR